MSGTHDADFAAAATKLGWALDAVIQLELDDLSSLPADLAPGARVLIRSNAPTLPAQLADHLKAAGLGWSVISVIEHIGSRDEQLRSQMAEFFALTDCAAPLICALSLGVRAGAEPTSANTSGPWG